MLPFSAEAFPTLPRDRHLIVSRGDVKCTPGRSKHSGGRPFLTRLRAVLLGALAHAMLEVRLHSTLIVHHRS